MSNEITVKEALALPGAKFVDVRSESEYAEATVPEAVNIPLLRDEERVSVGAAYKHEGVDTASALGFEIVTPRLSGMIKKFQDLRHDGPLVVFCWRGGMRSKSICSLLESIGIPVFRMTGGYKAYRRYINEYLSGHLLHRTVVIHGLTGVGKTEVLEELRQMSAPAVDLEGLANNRGSVFGQIGMRPQPSQKMFEALLVRELVFWSEVGYIIVECESRRIGRIILPESLAEAMRAGIRILAYCPIDKRIERIKKIYGGESGENRAELKAAIVSLGQRVGKKRVLEFSQMVDAGQTDEVVEYLLVKYYDPLYKYPSQPDQDYDLSVNTSDIRKAAVQIKDFLDHRMQPQSTN